MKKLFSALWKILVLASVYFILNAITGMLLPLSNDMLAAMTPGDQAAFMPIFLVKVIINMVVIYLLLTNLRFQGWKLVLGVWLSFWGLITVLNAIELYWYNEAFPLFSNLDVTKMIISSLISYGVTVLLGTWLVGGFKRAEVEQGTTFQAGRFGWKILLFSAAYALFYFACGFITRLFPAAVEFYASWAASMEPLPVLLSFNVLRGALWLAFSVPILLGVRTRKTAYWLLPLTLFNGTAMEHILPSAVLPGGVRLAHFIELGFSMIVVGLFMVWFFLVDKHPSVEDDHA